MKTDLPAIDDDLAPRKRVDLKAIRPRPVADEAVEKNSRVLGTAWGASTRVEPEVKTPIASLRIEVPDYVDHALALKAAQERVTKQYIVLCALKAYGFEVDPADLVPDKRKARR